MRMGTLFLPHEGWMGWWLLAFVDGGVDIMFFLFFRNEELGPGFTPFFLFLFPVMPFWASIYTLFRPFLLSVF